MYHKQIRSLRDLKVGSLCRTDSSLMVYAIRYGQSDSVIPTNSWFMVLSEPKESKHFTTHRDKVYEFEILFGEQRFMLPIPKGRALNILRIKKQRQ